MLYVNLVLVCFLIFEWEENVIRTAQPCLNYIVEIYSVSQKNYDPNNRFLFLVLVQFQS